MDSHLGSHEGSPREVPRVHASNPSSQWSAAEAAYLHPAVEGRSAATKPKWRETTVGQK